MKKHFNFLLIIITLILITGCSQKTEEQSDFNSDSVKILAVGNSYTAGAVTYLYSILEGFGVDEIVIGNMYMPTTDVTDQRYYIENNMTVYTYRKNDTNSDSKGMFVETKNTPIENVINEEEWDIIIFPNMKRATICDLNKYCDEDFDYLLNYFNEKCPNVPIYWHMTWAFQSDYQDPIFTALNNDQILMYEKIVGSVKEKILPENRFTKIIPCGTAIQNARTSYIGDTLTQDGYHLNALGNYIAGLTWVLCITDWDIRDFDTSYVPITFRNDFNVVYESVINAINKPYEITNSKHSEK